LSGLVAIIAPLAGGTILTRFGPGADFAIAAAILLLSAIPVMRMDRISAGPIPTFRNSFEGADRVGIAAFAADGWIASGLSVAWPMILFTTLGSQYDSYALSSSIAGLLGCAAGLICGRGIDRGSRTTYLPAACVALTAVFMLRIAVSVAPGMAQLANAAGAAAIGLYIPVIMSAIYERSKGTGAAYKFHIAAEAGWDLGAMAGCFAAALVSIVVGSSSLCLLPSWVGVVAIYICVHRATRLRPLGATAPQGGATLTQMPA
jgi:hypothetical protein